MHAPLTAIYVFLRIFTRLVTQNFHRQEGKNLVESYKRDIYVIR